MSMDLMVKVMKIKVGNPLRKLVLLKLADNASDQGECWPSYQHIADQCEIDRSTVRKHIKHLETQGLLCLENREGPKGNSSNLYRLTLENAGANGAAVGPRPTGGVGPRPTGGVGSKPTAVGSKPTGGVGPESTRTSHSPESVNEPVIEPITPQAADAPRGGELIVAEERRGPTEDRRGPNRPFQRPAGMEGPKDASAKTYKTWANYSVAYQKRYGAWPKWNATVAGMVSKFIDRVGEDVAPKIAAFYVGVNDSFVVKSQHQFKHLLSGAEQYHTQYVTGRSMTATRARQIDQSQANFSAADEGMEALRALRGQA